MLHLWENNSLTQVHLLSCIFLYANDIWPHAHLSIYIVPTGSLGIDDGT
jgi:hypothetical protein